MGCLRSELRIYSDLKIVAYEQLAAHYGNTSPLIHTVKEMGSLLVDQKITPDTLLLRRFTIHGVEIGIKPNEIFSKFMPLGKALIRYASEFDLFTASKVGNRTELRPLLHAPPDVSDMVNDTESFFEEAKVLGRLSFVPKNVLATHRNMEMTKEAHSTVLKLYLGYGRTLLRALTMRRSAEIEIAVNRMNECGDELWKKSSYYPRQATVVKDSLTRSDNDIEKYLGTQIVPHEQLISQREPLSRVAMRGSHLIRSLLYKAGLYGRPSNPVYDEQMRFVRACNDAGLDKVREREVIDVRALVKFLSNNLLQQFIWWG